MAAPDLTRYPTSVVEFVRRTLDDATTRDVQVLLYAGEFFDLEQLERLTKSVRTRPTYFVDLESLSIAADTGKDRLLINVYCCASNLRDEADQAMMSYQRANEARRILTRLEVPALAGVHSNGHIQYIGIAKELQMYGLTVHTLSLFVDLGYNI